MKQHPLKTSVCIGLVLALMHVAVSSPMVRAQQNQGNGQGSSSKEMPAPIRIAPGDLLHITVFDVPEMTQEVRIGAKGEAQMALIGNIDLAGLTGEEAAEAIARELRNRKLLLSPQVNVLIKEFASQGVSVIGEVQHPGVYQVLGSRSLLDLISMAGGLTSAADTRITDDNGEIEERRSGRFPCQQCPDLPWRFDRGATGGNRVRAGRRKSSGRLRNAGQRKNHSASGIGTGRGRQQKRFVE
jgi:protein involved in polysaccharide export with SLBB domain